MPSPPAKHQHKALTNKSIRLFIISATILLSPSASLADPSSIEQSWWLKYKSTEQPAAKSPAPLPAAIQPAQSTDNANTTGTIYFTAPSLSAPAPYIRPQETIISRDFSSAGSLPLQNYPVSSAFQFFSQPYTYGTISGAYPYSGFMNGLSTPGLYGNTAYNFGSGFGNIWSYGPSSGLFPGYLPSYNPLASGIPFAGSGYLGGMPYSGFSAWSVPFSYGGYATPAANALMMGAFSGNHSNLGTIEPTRVFQSAPSKSSGNYYAPSTQDTTASGSYYASSSPAQIPVMQTNKNQNFWGASGSPFKDLNSKPW